MALEIKIDKELMPRRQELLEAQLLAFKKQVEEKFSGPEKEKVLLSLDFMLKIHLPQKDRVDGQPFASHPLAVAEKVLEMEADADLVCSALLHDSVEDQYDHVFTQRVNRRFPDKDFIHLKIDPENKKKYKEILKKWSFKEIKELFGLPVEYYVENMTNHDFSSMAEDLGLEGEEKRDFVNRLYSEHVEMIISDPKLFTLKLADLSVNIDLHSLPEESPKKEKLKRKYKTVIENFISKLEEIDLSHPLFSKKEKLISSLKEIHRNQYQE